MSYAITFDATGGLSLSHHGIKGMRWGIRRYQNEDGSLTAAGRKRYGTSENFENYQNYRSAKKDYNRAYSNAFNRHGVHLSKKGREKNAQRWQKVNDAANALDPVKKKYKTSNQEFKTSKKIEAISKNESKIMASRAKREAKLSAKLENYKMGHEVMSKGYEKYKSITTDYGDAKIKALNDPSFKSTETYKRAVKGYKRLARLEADGGMSYAALYYAIAPDTDNLDKPLVTRAWLLNRKK